MTYREKIVKELYDLRRYLEDKEWSDNRVDRRTAKVYWQTVTDAIAMLKEQETVEHALDVLRKNGWKEEETCEKCTLLKEQEVLLKRAYELLADMDLDFFCEDLICNDGWCDDHCTTNGTTPECIERWLRKQISEGR